MLAVSKHDLLFAASHIGILLCLFILPGSASSQFVPDHPASQTHLFVSTQTALAGQSGEHTEIETDEIGVIINYGAEMVLVIFISKIYINIIPTSMVLVKTLAWKNYLALFCELHQNSTIVISDSRSKNDLYFADLYIGISMSLFLLPGSGSSQVAPEYPALHTQQSIPTQTPLVPHPPTPLQSETHCI